MTKKKNETEKDIKVDETKVSDKMYEEVVKMNALIEHLMNTLDRIEKRLNGGF